MGVDINLCIEQRASSGRWERIEPRLDRPVLPGRYRAEEPRIARNRVLWDLLAFGVAIERWHDVIETFVEPVARPRGIPPDAAPDTLMEYEAQKDRSYGFNWLLVRELEQYDWDQEVVHTNRHILGTPSSMGPEWIPYGEPFPNREGRLLQDYVCRPGHTYREAVRHFLEETLPELQAVGPSDQVRMVFWFW